MAEHVPDEFRTYAQRLQDSPYETAQFLLVRGYAGNGAKFSDEAVGYLCGHPSCLALGYLSEPHWATRQLVEAATPHCTAERLSFLEQTLLTYYSPYERRARGHRQQGRAQLTLLEGISLGRRSPAVVRRLGELRRKFGETATQEGIPTVRTGWVGAPIEEGAAEKMSDAQWMSAIVRYNDIETRTERSGRFIGGADYLATVLQRQVKSDPTRFARILCRFPDTTHAIYFDAVLRGLRESGVKLDRDLLAAVIRGCHQLPGHPCGMELCRLIEKYADDALSSELLAALAWYATEDPNPEREMWRMPSPSGVVYYAGDIVNAGINSVRGAAARAIAALIAVDRSRTSFFTPTLDHLTCDPSLAVRSCGAYALLAVFQHEPDLGIGLFLRLCDAEDILLKATSIEGFLLTGVRAYFTSLVPLIRRMLTSELSEVAMAGARVACYASFFDRAAEALANECLEGSAAQRQGAAQVFAMNLRVPEERGTCETALLRLINDAEVSVREEVADCFVDFHDQDVAEHRQFIEAFILSQAFATNPFPLLHASMETGLKDDVLTCLVCERFLDVTGSALVDIRTHASAYAHRIGEVLAQIYKRTDVADMRTRCFVLIERMAQAGVRGMTQLLDNLER